MSTAPDADIPIQLVFVLHEFIMRFIAIVNGNRPPKKSQVGAGNHSLIGVTSFQLSVKPVCYKPVYSGASACVNLLLGRLRILALPLSHKSSLQTPICEVTISNELQTLHDIDCTYY